MSKKNTIIAIVIINALAIAGIFYEIGYFDEAEVDNSTLVTASLKIEFDNLDGNETMAFNLITTSESTAYGILMSAKTEGMYDVTVSQTNNGIIVESINNWGSCEGCQSEQGYTWKYTVNDVPSDTAANRKVINDGDAIHWIYSE
tara:strand:+ start:81 stop:515 length:435 start_codon:yes stop_codon:yes gene_type:complete